MTISLSGFLRVSALTAVSLFCVSESFAASTWRKYSDKIWIETTEGKMEMSASCGNNKWPTDFGKDYGSGDKLQMDCAANQFRWCKSPIFGFNEWSVCGAANPWEAKDIDDIPPPPLPVVDKAAREKFLGSIKQTRIIEANGITHYCLMQASIDEYGLENAGSARFYVAGTGQKLSTKASDDSPKCFDPATQNWTAENCLWECDNDAQWKTTQSNVVANNTQPGSSEFDFFYNAGQAGSSAVATQVGAALLAKGLSEQARQNAEARQNCKAGEFFSNSDDACASCKIRADYWIETAPANTICDGETPLAKGTRFLECSDDLGGAAFAIPSAWTAANNICDTAKKVDDIDFQCKKFAENNSLKPLEACPNAPKSATGTGAAENKKKTTGGDQQTTDNNNKGKTKIVPVPQPLNLLAMDAKLTDYNRFVSAKGEFMGTKRILVDSAFGVAFGALGGFGVNRLMASSQSETGFENVQCSVDGTPLAGWNDSFSIAPTSAE
ncbi:MAG: hypothetical protein LBG89_03210 [Rickettsiales bacterium]|jgi:hypothetical protein|nr:hypothetical protein [Rickettsiales bacterium]